MNWGTWHDWRQLLRAANVLTAVSNVVAGALVAEGRWPAAVPWMLAAAASVLLYEAGMVLNDAFDAEEDARERPERPIPAGRVDRRAAQRAGAALLAAGNAAAAAAAWHVGRFPPVLVAACLSAMILMYDGGLKRTWAGPLAMGWCRTLNVLLGASIAADSGALLAAAPVALGVGLYTLGVTRIARGETSAGTTRGLRGGLAAALGGALLLGLWGLSAARLPADGLWLAGMTAILACVLGPGPLAWLKHADPLSVRRHVGRMIVGFLAIDAYAAGMSAGWGAAVAVGLLVLPTLAMARSTPMS